MILYVTSEITAVQFRHLNSFEWAVLEILTTFPSQAPTTQEATEQLNLHEPAFIKSAIDSLASIKAIEKRTGEPIDSDLQNFTLTDQGKEVFKSQGWEIGGPETHIQEFSLEWPTSKILYERKHSTNYNKTGVKIPPNEVIQSRLNPDQMETRLNSQTSQSWKVKSFYISNAELE